MVSNKSIRKTLNALKTGIYSTVSPVTPKAGTVVLPFTQEEIEFIKKNAYFFRKLRHIGVLRCNYKVLPKVVPIYIKGERDEDYNVDVTPQLFKALVVEGTMEENGCTYHMDVKSDMIVHALGDKLKAYKKPIGTSDPVELAKRHSGAKSLLKECLETGTITTINIEKCPWNKNMFWYRDVWRAYVFDGYAITHSSKPGVSSDQPGLGYKEEVRTTYKTNNDTTLLEFVCPNFSVLICDENEITPIAFVDKETDMGESTFAVDKNKVKELLALM